MYRYYISSGMRFHVIWNDVPYNMESPYKIEIPRSEVYFDMFRA